MNKIIKGDQVVVITGKDKGKQGQVVRVLGDKVVVEGVNVVKRHQNLIQCVVLRVVLLLKKCLWIFLILQS